MTELNLPDEPPKKEPPDPFTEANVSAVIESLRIERAAFSKAHAQLQKALDADADQSAGAIELLQETLDAEIAKSTELQGNLTLERKNLKLEHKKNTQHVDDHATLIVTLESSQRHEKDLWYSGIQSRAEAAKASTWVRIMGGLLAVVAAAAIAEAWKLFS